MTLTRFALPLLLVLASEGAVAAPQVTAEGAMANYRKMLKPVRELDCPSGGSGEEIVVCGRTPGEIQRDRLPLPVTREPGEHIPGEPSADGGGCIRLCGQPVMVPLHKAPAFIGKLIERIKDR